MNPENLIKCSDCGGEVSRRAEACPHCGAPMASGGGGVFSTTLKVVMSLLVIAAVLGLLLIVVVSSTRLPDERPGGDLKVTSKSVTMRSRGTDYVLGDCAVSVTNERSVEIRGYLFVDGVDAAGAKRADDEFLVVLGGHRSINMKHPIDAKTPDWDRIVAWNFRWLEDPNAR